MKKKSKIGHYRPLRGMYRQEDRLTTDTLAVQTVRDWYLITKSATNILLQSHKTIAEFLFPL